MANNADPGLTRNQMRRSCTNSMKNTPSTNNTEPKYTTFLPGDRVNCKPLALISSYCISCK